MGIIVKCNPLDPAHRESVLLLVTAELSDEMRYSEFKEHFADCDVLHDKERERQPAEIWITRCVLWLAAGDRVMHEDMEWVEPIIVYALVDDWDTKECYGQAAAYGRVLADSLAARRS